MRNIFSSVFYFLRSSVRRGVFVATVVSWFSLLAPLADASTVLRTRGTQFVDAQGRTVFLRGVNVSTNAKTEPWISFRDFSVFKNFKKAGFNSIRLLFNWEAYQANYEKPDEEYLRWLKSAAQAAGREGLYVIVDFHQDAFSRYSLNGCGDGFPAWAIPKGDAPATPDNGARCKAWATKAGVDNMFRGPMFRAFRAFYDDSEGTRTRFIRLWGKLARTFRDVPQVVGYDILNEPWVQLLPGNREVADLAPLYAEVTAAIRAEDPSAIVFIEPQTSVNIGLAQTTLAKPAFENFAYAPHFYDPNATVKWNKSKTLINASMAAMKEISKKWNAPVFIGEFGVAASVENGPEFLDEVYAQLTANGFSAAQWGYSPRWNARDFDGWNQEDFSLVDQHGEWRTTFRPHPHVPRLAGSGLKLEERYFEDGAINSVEVAWHHDPAQGSTEIFLPADARDDGLGIKAKNDPELECHFVAEQSSWSCHAEEAGPKNVIFSK